VYRSYHSLVRYFRENLSPPSPVTVRRVRLRPGLDGWCACGRRGFTIKIDRRLPEYFAIEVLIHEFAHVLSWGKDKNPHGVEWGKAYSLVYRKFLEWNEQQRAA
jgi:hypothetical protein